MPAAATPNYASWTAHPLAKVLVRAPINGETARALGVPFGRATRDEHGTLVVGSAPGEWLLLAPPGTAEEVIQRVEEIPDEEMVSVFDATHGRAMVRITGARAADLLSKVCAIDFSGEITPNGGGLPKLGREGRNRRRARRPGQ